MEIKNKIWKIDELDQWKKAEKIDFGYYFYCIPDENLIHFKRFQLTDRKELNV